MRKENYLKESEEGGYKYLTCVHLKIHRVQINQETGRFIICMTKGLVCITYKEFPHVSKR